jgi:DNA-directed RNA polymerase specialized sigma24 family protein
MSATVLAQLYAVADTSGIPPGVPSEFEIECAPTDLVEVDVIVEDAAQENSAAAVDQSTMLPDTHAPGADPDLWLYRKRTVGLLRRYMRLSIEVGRMPSLLGREFFRTRVTSYRAATFEDAVIFVHDVERSLEKLSDFDKKVIAKTVLQEYPQEEAARLIGCGQRHLARCYVEALDRVSEIFLKRRLLLRLPCVKSESKNLVKGVKPMNLT